MRSKTLKTESGAGVSVEAATNQILQLGSKNIVIRPVRKTKKDLCVRLEGDVSTDHVMEKDSKRPNGQTISSVSSVLDPFWRSVHSGA